MVHCHLYLELQQSTFIGLSATSSNSSAHSDLLPQIFSPSILPLINKSLLCTLTLQKSSALTRSFWAGNSWTLSLRSLARFSTHEPLAISSGTAYWICWEMAPQNKGSKKKNSIRFFIISVFLEHLCISLTLWKASFQDVSGMFKKSAMATWTFVFWGRTCSLGARGDAISVLTCTGQSRKMLCLTFRGAENPSSLWSIAAPGGCLGKVHIA